MLELAPEKDKDLLQVASIKVIGVGGAGGNTINSMLNSDYHGVDFVVANTDAQALKMSKSKTKIQIGVKSTKGLGSGANPEVGRRAAEEDIEQILEAIGSTDIVFLTAGMGGGTGSGALPVIARALKERGILSIAIVTRPFDFEGTFRSRVADEAIKSLKKEVDTLVVIPNQRLLEVADQNVSMVDAFSMINDVLNQSVSGIVNIITKPGHINVDFADLRAVMKDMGMAVMGTGKASGQDRARKAASQSISSPLLENMSIKGARGVLLNITCGPNLGLQEMFEAASVIREQAAVDANIIIGSVIDETMQDDISVTVIATGFEMDPTAPRASCPLQADKTVVREAPAVMREPEAPAPTVAAPSMASRPVEYEAQLAAEREDSTSLVDMDNLDVPTFLRKEAQRQSE